MTMATRRPMGSLEAAVLDVLWKAPGPATPAEVKVAVGHDDLAYTTVMTVLTRLWAKGLVERERRGRAYAYRPVVSEADLAAQRMMSALEAAHDPNAVLSRFVDKLPRRQEQALRKLFEEMS